MSLGSLAGLGGGLSIDTASSCACQQFNPLLYPPDPCCTGNGNGCGDNGGGGNGGGTDGGPGKQPGWYGIAPPGGGNGNGGCCSDNGGGPFLSPNDGSGGSSCGCGNSGGIGNMPQGSGGSGSIAICLDSTYGGGRGSVPTPRGNIRNGAALLPLAIYSEQPCVSPVGTAPAAVPGSGSAFSVHVLVEAGNTISGLLVNCHETGVTLTSGCTIFDFHLPASGTYTYSTAGGGGQDCSTLQNHTYSAGSTQAPSSQIMVVVQVTKIV